jgi:hypothetical protein
VSRYQRFWAVSAIALGAWEGTAVSTKRLPTVTDSCRWARRRKVGLIAIMLWWLGLGWHLLKSGPAAP